jgi:hypothetical protein
VVPTAPIFFFLKTNLPVVKTRNLDPRGEKDEQGSEEGGSHGRQTEDLLRLQVLKFEDPNTGMSTFHREK